MPRATATTTTTITTIATTAPGPAPFVPVPADDFDLLRIQFVIDKALLRALDHSFTARVPPPPSLQATRGDSRVDSCAAPPPNCAPSQPMPTVTSAAAIGAQVRAAAAAISAADTLPTRKLAHAALTAALSGGGGRPARIAVARRPDPQPPLTAHVHADVHQQQDSHDVPRPKRLKNKHGPTRRYGAAVLVAAVRAAKGASAAGTSEEEKGPHSWCGLSLPRAGQALSAQGFGTPALRKAAIREAVDGGNLVPTGDGAAFIMPGDVYNDTPADDADDVVSSSTDDDSDKENGSHQQQDDDEDCPAPRSAALTLPCQHHHHREPHSAAAAIAAAAAAAAAADHFRAMHREHKQRFGGGGAGGEPYDPWGAALSPSQAAPADAPSPAAVSASSRSSSAATAKHYHHHDHTRPYAHGCHPAMLTKNKPSPTHAAHRPWGPDECGAGGDPSCRPWIFGAAVEGRHDADAAKLQYLLQVVEGATGLGAPSSAPLTLPDAPWEIVFGGVAVAGGCGNNSHNTHSGNSAHQGGSDNTHKVVQPSPAAAGIDPCAPLAYRCPAPPPAPGCSFTVASPRATPTSHPSVATAAAPPAPAMPTTTAAAARPPLPPRGTLKFLAAVIAAESKPAAPEEELVPCHPW